MTKHDEWRIWLADEMDKPYFKDILKKLKDKEEDYLIIPDKEYIMRALEFPEIEDIKVIITGDKPPLEAVAADGLAFSSLDKPTLAMKNIYGKIWNELQVRYDANDHTKDRWVSQGVLLLNMELTLALGERHPDNLWEPFTTRVLEYFLKDDQPRAFLFFDGTTAWVQFRTDINDKHLLITTTPYGLTFKEDIPVFRRVKKFLLKHYKAEINWS